MATLLDDVDTEHFRHCRKSCWIAPVHMKCHVHSVRNHCVIFTRSLSRFGSPGLWRPARPLGPDGGRQDCPPYHTVPDPPSPWRWGGGLILPLPNSIRNVGKSVTRLHPAHPSPLNFPPTPLSLSLLSSPFSCWHLDSPRPASEVPTAHSRGGGGASRGSPQLPAEVLAAWAAWAPLGRAEMIVCCDGGSGQPACSNVPVSGSQACCLHLAGPQGLA